MEALWLPCVNGSTLPNPGPAVDYGFFGPASITWKVWSYPTSLTIGFQRAVVVEELDPHLIAAVDKTQGIYQRPRTGLAQLVAEELECDWSKVTTEYPTPGQNVARKRAWGEISHRRQPRHPHLARICPQGRRCRAHHADPGGGQ